MNPPPLEYVGFRKRFVATIVDSILLCLVIYPPLIRIYGWSYLDRAPTDLVAGPADLVIAWILPIFLYIGFWIWKQATPGKLYVNARIVDAVTGAKPTLMQWIVRYLGYFVSTAPLGLGFLWIAFDNRCQGWHDKLAGTVVVPKTNGNKNRNKEEEDKDTPDRITGNEPQWTGNTPRPPDSP